MSEKTAVRTREKWVDDVKVIACILVVLGHFFQSMTKANILPENDLYEWFETTIYYFHVPWISVSEVQQGKQCGKLAQKCCEKGVGTRHTLCHFYNCYMGAEKGIFE